MSTLLVDGLQALAVTAPRGGERDKCIVILVLYESALSKKMPKW
jgi:hypothetical protein